MALIHVTQEHIARGEPFDAERCMVVLALGEETGLDWLVDGCYAMPAFGFRGKRIGPVLLPEHVQAAILKFDHGQEVEPFEFEFEYAQAPCEAH